MQDSKVPPKILFLGYIVGPLLCPFPKYNVQKEILFLEGIKFTLEIGFLDIFGASRVLKCV
jgi:hypothetical protein